MAGSTVVVGHYGLRSWRTRWRREERCPASTTGPAGLDRGGCRAIVSARGLGQRADERTSRSLAEIARANIFTRFNAILGTMFVLILVFGEAQDALFGFVLVINTLIGIVQEWRAKRTLDRLAVLSAPERARRARRRRARDRGRRRGARRPARAARRRPGRRPTASCASADGLEIDESLLTGESEPVDKEADDGGAVGQHRRGRSRAGTRRPASAPTSYARRLATEARRFTLTRSELVDGIEPDPALRAVGDRADRARCSRSASSPRSTTTSATRWRAPSPAWSRWSRRDSCCSRAWRSRVAAVTLARRRVLVQELPAVEGLARVDVVLLDKTGTITEGAIALRRPASCSPTGRPVDGGAGRAGRRREPQRARCRPCAEAFPAPAGWDADRRGAVLVGPQVERGDVRRRTGTWVFGAPEMVWAGRPADDPVRRQGRGARRGRASRAAPRAHRTAARRRDLARAARRRRARDVRGADPARRGRDARRTSRRRACGAW